MERRGSYIKAVCLALIVILIAAALPDAENTSAKERKLKVYYTNYGLVGGIMVYRTRKKVTSYLTQKWTKYGKKREVGEITNSTKKTASRGLTVSESTTRTISLSASTTIPKAVLKNDVSITIGGSLSFNKTISVSVQAKVPPRSSRSVYLRYKRSKAKYKYVVQPQKMNTLGKWVNTGKKYTRYNTVTTRVPSLIV